MKYVIFGGANLDINAVSDNKIIEHDSNIGNITFTFGGVARNITENLCRLGNDVSFISIFSNDAFGNAMYQNLLDLNCNLDNSFKTSTPQCSYLNLLDYDNDLSFGINSMKALDEVKLEDVKKIKIDKDAVLVIDTNYSKDILEYLVNLPNYKVLDTISTTKAKRVMNHLGKINLLKVNKIEALTLSNKETLIEAIKTIPSKEILASDGKNGFYYKNNDKIYKISHNSIQAACANGAGDALLSGFIYDLKAPLEERIKNALACSFLSLKSTSACNPNLNKESLKEEMKTIHFEIEEVK